MPISTLQEITHKNYEIWSEVSQDKKRYVDRAVLICIIRQAMRDNMSQELIWPEIIW